jgi:uncharacterized membrane protein
MAMLDKRIEVRATPDAVFAFLGHVERWPRWLPFEVRAARVTEREGKGMVVRHESAACGTRLSWDAVAEEWLPGKRQAWRQLQGDWKGASMQWDLQASPEGTVVRLRAELALPHMLDVEMTEAAAQQELSSCLDDALLNLKDALEG